jgi:hypothetical protein
VAQIVNQTSWNLSASGSFTIPQPAAGHVLVCASYGAATVALKCGSTSWNKRTPTSLSSFEVACADYTATGSGETTVTVTLNGSEPVRGIVWEFASLGAYIGGTAPNTTSVSSKTAALAGVTTTGNALMISSFLFGTNTDSTAQDQWWGLSPQGYVYQTGYYGTSAKWWGQIGLSDCAGAGTYGASSCTNRGTSVQAGCWLYTDTSGVATNPAYPNATVAENTNAGTATSVWAGVTTSSEIAGYCDQRSYAPGATVNMQVDSDDVGFTATIFRLGAYGYAAYGARQVGQVTGSPATQSAPSVDSLGATVCSWSTTASWTIPSTAQPGVYMVLWRRTDNSSYVSQGLFVVHSPSNATNQVAVIVSDQTWQAYNIWGATTDSGESGSGKNLYGGGTEPGTITNRSYAVSFNRPYSTPSSDAITSLWDSEFSLINFLEANGYDCAYYSMADLEGNTAILQGHTLMVINGHCEYWTLNQRTAVQNALNAGVNLASFSSNTMLWRVRFASGDTGYRYMICYKDTVSGESIDPGGYTGTWRDPGSYNTDNWPEQAQLGQEFLASTPNNTYHTFATPYSALPCYRNTPNIAALTGASTYTVSECLTIGEEVDWINTASSATPNNIVALNSQSFAVSSVAPAAGYPYTGSGTYNLGPTLAQMANGALVFAAGTWRLQCAASPFRLSAANAAGAVDTNIQQMIVNLLCDLGAQPESLLTATTNATTSGLVSPLPAQGPNKYGLAEWIPAAASQLGGSY